MYVYQRLKDTREDADKKQEDIAAILNITRQQYQLYESGKREMPMHHFIALAKFYNLSLDYLAGLIDTPKRLYRIFLTREIYDPHEKKFFLSRGKNISFIGLN